MRRDVAGLLERTLRARCETVSTSAAAGSTRESGRRAISPFPLLLVT
jgi:hypothetical protein